MNRKLKNCLDTYQVPKVKEAQIESLLALLPSNGHKYDSLKSLAFRLLWKQGKFIFLLQFIISICSILVSYYIFENQLILLSITSILTVTIFMSYLLRSFRHHTWELEKACVMHNSKITLFQILILGFIDLISLFILVLFFFYHTNYSLLFLISYSFLPFFLISTFALFSASIFHSPESIFASYGVGCLFMIFFQFNIPLKDITWFSLCIITILTFIITSRYFYKKNELESEGLLWN